MLKWVPLILLTAVTACSKLDNFNQKKAEYRTECFGDQSVKCRSMLVDLNVTKLETAIEMASSKKEKLIACRGQHFYDEGLAVIHEKIAYFKELKPGIFARTFLSGAQVEFDPASFRRDPDFERFLIAASECENRTGAVAPIAATPADSGPSGQVDSNAQNRPTTLETVAGTLTLERAANGLSTVNLNGNPLFSGGDAQWQFPLHKFQLSSSRQAILMASSGGRGNSCETLFFFLVVERTGIKSTPEFGTCAPQGSFSQRGDRITLTLPRMGGNTLYAFEGTTVTEDGKLVALEDSNNPAK